MDNFASMLNDKIEITIDLDDDVTNYKEIETKLQQMPQTKSVAFVTKEEAYDIMEKEMGADADVLNVLGDNPFPARFIIKINNPDEVSHVVEEINAWQVAEHIQYGENHVEKIMSIAKNARNVGVIGTVIGTVFSIFIVMSVIKINIAQRRREIEIKELVGASMMTIRLPFILEAMLLTGLASAIIYLGYYFGYQHLLNRASIVIPSGVLTDLRTVMNSITLPLVAFGVGIGFFGGFFSTSRMLKKY